MTFRVIARDRGGNTDEVLLERTVTTPHRWETATVDMAGRAGHDVTLSLVLASEKPRALGFWGTPVIRSIPEKGAATGAAAAPSRPQGVILVWMDTLRRDHLPMYGYARPTSPNLARIAAEGTTFDDCVAQATWTKASGPSILTGLYPSTHGVQSFNDLLPSSATTIAEVYRQAGYSTLGLETIQFVGKFSNQHQGFEELHEQARSRSARRGAPRPRAPRSTALIPGWPRIATSPSSCCCISPIPTARTGPTRLTTRCSATPRAAPSTRRSGRRCARSSATPTCAASACPSARRS